MRALLEKGERKSLLSTSLSTPPKSKSESESNDASPLRFKDEYEFGELNASNDSAPLINFGFGFGFAYKRESSPAPSSAYGKDTDNTVTKRMTRINIWYALRMR